MVRIKCKVSYDGSKFYGFQVQNKERTIQGEIQKALKNICQSEVIIHASGRTDAKVHAKAQIFHFDTTKQMPSNKWKMAMNHFLPNDIHILECEEVDENFHSRYSAVQKEYRYYLSTNEYSPFETNYIYQYNRPLNLQLMQEAAKLFIGKHDFASYCSYDQYGNTIRTIYKFEVNEKNGIVEFIVRGDGFRRYMVRHLVGALIQIGAHRFTINQAKDRLESCGKEHILFKAKPQGLYLYQVDYE
ncbi:MAG: tRNA pseudouridine(38-40) synthase TruA [Erysipelotrichaceae bacterium]|nr:tRNA pseudouridine(38-40) synthase TruA [Erysipelotrichaceae bacterium]